MTESTKLFLLVAALGVGYWIYSRETAKSQPVARPIAARAPTASGGGGGPSSTPSAPTSPPGTASTAPPSTITPGANPTPAGGGAYATPSPTGGTGPVNTFADIYGPTGLFPVPGWVSSQPPINTTPIGTTPTPTPGAGAGAGMTFAQYQAWIASGGGSVTPADPVPPTGGPTDSPTDDLPVETPHAFSGMIGVTMS